VRVHAQRARGRSNLKRNLLAIGCACLGGVIGYLGFWVLLAREIYAVVLPGGLLGLAAGIVRAQSPLVAVVCSLLAVVAGLLTEHQAAPFVADRSLSFFVRHILDLQPLTQISIAVGGLIGFWIPFRRRIRFTV
jgi:hypothetical protein